MNKNLKIIFQVILWSAILSGCITDPGTSKKTGRVTDFTLKANLANGCGKGFVMWSQLNYCSINSCPAGSHIASTIEMADVRKYITDMINYTPVATTTPGTNPYTTPSTPGLPTPQPPNNEVPKGGTVDQALLTYISNSAGVCLVDLPPVRPTGQVYINNDVCSCLNGVSDIINDCAAVCSTRPKNAIATLYLNATVGPDIQLNASLKDLQGWCTANLPNDKVNAGCTLSAWDGFNTIAGIKVNVSGNSLTADLTSLSLNKTYIVKIVESLTGSNAQSVEFQIRRVPPPTVVSGQVGALKVAPISQYTCLSYSKSLLPNGQVVRDAYVRQLYYFAANATPPPLAPLTPGVVSTIVCHDETLHPGSDSVMYPRLELIPQHFSLWDIADQRFASDSLVVAVPKLKINTIIEQRLLAEYNMIETQDLFKVIKWPNRPTPTTATAQTVPMGYMMIPFLDPVSGKTMCPTRTDFLTSTVPKFRILKDYIDSTEAVYLGEKEPEILMTNGVPTYSYGTMFITEGVVKKYAFYIENGLKIKADQAALESKTIYYYWPINNSMDPLQQGDRKLFTIRFWNALNGTQPVDVPGNQTTDKRLGCVPTTTVP